MAQSQSPKDLDQVEPPRLKFLRWLVIVLTVVMIVGLITIITLIVMTFLRTGNPDVVVPSQLSIPESERALAYTRSVGWHAVVTQDTNGQERIYIMDPTSGEVRQSIEIVKPDP